VVDTSKFAAQRYPWQQCTDVDVRLAHAVDWRENKIIEIPAKGLERLQEVAGRPQRPACVASRRCYRSWKNRRLQEQTRRL